jgi:plasmid maintenance system killer protein
MIPDIKPHGLEEYTVKQSKYTVAPVLPTRALLLAPSGCGKTILLQNFILDIYRDCFARVFIWSPSIWVDQTWRPVMKYIEDHMHVKHTEEDPIYFEDYNNDDLEKVIDEQKKVIQYMKDKNKKRLYQILIIIDDHADNPALSRNSKLLHSLYTRGRHNMISTIVSVQSYTSLHPIIRRNVTDLMVYRLKNVKDLENVLEELSALMSKKHLLQLYHYCVEQPYGFLYVKLNAKNKNDMFFYKFNQKLIIED